MKNIIIDPITLMPIEGAFEVDGKMYPILRVLWDKGYKTRFSCAGHSQEEEVLKTKFDKKDYGAMSDDLKKEMVITNVLGDQYEGYSKNFETIFQITFGEIYDFENVPEGFVCGNLNIIKYINGENSLIPVTCISKNIFTYATYEDYLENKRRSTLDIESELEIVRNKILTWANSLPVLENTIIRAKVK